MLTEYSVLRSAVGSGRPRPSIGSEVDGAPDSLIAESRGQAAPKEMEEEEEVKSGLGKFGRADADRYVIIILARYH
jgi:hypothetical protein